MAIHSVRFAKTNIILVKIDVKKAYDHVNRSFLLKVLEKSGFHPNWISWIWSCTSTPYCSMLVNGSPQGFFSTSRGIRQGDPLSPFLFIIIVEALKHMINRSRIEGCWKAIKISRGVDDITHTQFANDTLLMSEATVHEARVIKLVLDKYC